MTLSGGRRTTLTDCGASAGNRTPTGKLMSPAVGVGDYLAAITDDRAREICMCGRNYLSCLNLFVMRCSMILAPSRCKMFIITNSK